MYSRFDRLGATLLTTFIFEGDVSMTSSNWLKIEQLRAFFDYLCASGCKSILVPPVVFSLMLVHFRTRA